MLSEILWFLLGVVLSPYIMEYYLNNKNNNIVKITHLHDDNYMYQIKTQ
jgi:hypothetical protein